MTRPHFRTVLARRLPLIVPSAAALVCAVASIQALHALTFAPLGRDQGIFQYVGWALRHGARGYHDFHEINGPLPHVWHFLMQVLGGEDEHVFRTIDTVMIAVAYGAAAATTPLWLGLKASRAEKVAWALAGLGILGAQYARYDWWHTSQREGLYSVLLYGSLSLQAVGHHTRCHRRAALCFGASGMLTALTWLGKPPCVIFAVLQLCVLLYDRGTLAIPVKRALGAAAVGASASVVGVLAFVVVYEDAVSAVHMLSSVPLLHHTIWNKSLVECYQAYGNAPRLDWALATAAVFVGLFFVLKLPRRSLLVLVLPVGGFVVFAGQGKGFPYHMHMLTLGTGVAQLVLMAALADWGRRVEMWADFVVIGVLGFALEARETALLSPGIKGEWANIGARAEQRGSASYLEDFAWPDFFALDLRQAAAYLRTNTRPDDRIQTYGLDPYLLALSQRHSATPVIYDFELNVDAALEVGAGATLSAADRAGLIAYRQRAEQLVFEKVQVSPPAAFVFLDRAPFAYPEDGEADFAKHCPTIYKWLEPRYAAAIRFGTIRVRLRSDLAARAAPHGGS